jgi:glutathione reductase (NADPH)
MSLPINGAEHMVTSDQFLELSALPHRIVFVGGGFISFEFAHFVARLGDSEARQTTILEAASRPLGPFDAEMVAQLEAASASEGIGIHSGVNIQAIETSKDGYRVLTDSGEHTADLVVNGAGRSADIDGLSLSSAGVDRSTKGIVVNASMQTSNPRIYAVGDCAATVQLARVADYEASVAANAILGDDGDPRWGEMDYAAVPALLFTYPQYGMVGKTEQTLEAEGAPYRKNVGKNLGWPTYRRVGMTHAAFKILVDDEGCFLGGHFLSDNAGGLAHTLHLAMCNGITAGKLYRQCIMSPYPTRESDLTYMLKPLAEK